jgi:hypothetical protein
MHLSPERSHAQAAKVIRERSTGPLLDTSHTTGEQKGSTPS